MSNASSRQSIFPLVGLFVLLALVGAVFYTVALDHKGPEENPNSPTTETTSPQHPSGLAAWFTQDQIGFAPLNFSPKDLKASYQPWSNAPLPSKLEMDQLLNAMRAMHRAELAQNAQGMAAMQQAFGLQLKEIYSGRKLSGLHKALEEIYPAFKSSLQALSNHSVEHNTDLRSVLYGKEKELKEHRELVGSFPLLGQKLGLLNDKGQLPPEKDVVLKVLFRYRIFHALNRVANPRALLTLEERRILNLWRLQEAKNINLEKRLRYIEELAEALPEYPGIVAQGIVYHQAGDQEKALEHFEKASKIAPSLQPLMTSWKNHLSPAPQSPTN